MTLKASSLGNITTKFIATLIVLVCVAIGIIGLVVPLVPGMLFLAIAALIAARHSRTLERTLRQNTAIAGYLDSADGFIDLPLGQKVRIGGLVCLRILIRGIALVAVTVSRLFRPAMTRHR